MPPFILPLADIASTLETVGGKGMSLSILARAGLPVPGGFHVTTDAYRRFIADNELQAPILETVKKADASQFASLETAAHHIRMLFDTAPVPAEISSAISAACSNLGDTPVAVRSSATAEDLPDASFAGLQNTYLNIRGEKAILEAVKWCWA